MLYLFVNKYLNMEMSKCRHHSVYVTSFIAAGRDFGEPPCNNSVISGLHFCSRLNGCVYDRSTVSSLNLYCVERSRMAKTPSESFLESMLDMFQGS